MSKKHSRKPKHSKKKQVIVVGVNDVPTKLVNGVTVISYSDLPKPKGRRPRTF